MSAASRPFDSPSERQRGAPSARAAARRVEPGGTLGILGGGQLGRMLAIAARRWGFAVEVYSPERRSPAGQLADHEWTAPFDDHDQLAEFARRVDVVTYELEHLPVEAVSTIERWTPVRPGAELLRIAQNRFLEKSWLRRLGIPTAPFRLVRSPAELIAALAEWGGRGILKTTTQGYDGRGQQRIESVADAACAWRMLEGREAIVEGLVEFRREFSMIGARGLDGALHIYSPIENRHRDGILDVSVSPSQRIAEADCAAAEEITRVILEESEAIGVVCVEFFDTAGGPVVNELAPRPHNSGHLTLDAHPCCQFEQQLRAVCGLPLGDCRQLRPAAMANLLGEHLPEDESGTEALPGARPTWLAALNSPHTRLHLYGKGDARPGRKMGHLTALADTPEEAERRVLEARRSLQVGSERAGDRKRPRGAEA